MCTMLYLYSIVGDTQIRCRYTHLHNLKHLLQLLYTCFSSYQAELRHREKMQMVASQMAECNKSIVLSKEKYKAILALLRNPSERVCPRFRHWVKNRRFRIMDLPEMGLTGVLAIPDRESFVSMLWYLSFNC